MNKCLNCEKEVKAKYCNVSCQNKHQGATRMNKVYGELKLFDVNCNKCEKRFQVEEREKLFPQKETYYCSRACANTRIHSDETKAQIKSTLESHTIVGSRNIDKDKTCKECSATFNSRKKNSKFCSRSCQSAFTMRDGHASSLGKKSVLKQGDTRRSKNEIYFASLCKERFLVLENKPMFNGWDADVILPELKLAVLWNGVWHYKKITEQHSVEQVQNRDKIKLKEIEAAGYKSYVIKDMGSENKSFVEEKFKEMLVYLKL